LAAAASKIFEAVSEAVVIQPHTQKNFFEKQKKCCDFLEKSPLKKKQNRI